MLEDYRRWLISELKLLGNASHHAYSFGQANMAKRAIEKLDEALAGGVFVKLTKENAEAALAALDASATPSAPALAHLSDAIRASLAT
jgi:hypothetical protein